jgi:hypothetical protein
VSAITTERPDQFSMPTMAAALINAMTSAQGPAISQNDRWWSAQCRKASPTK